MSPQPSLKALILRHRLALALSAILAALGSALGLLPYYLVYLVSREVIGQDPALVDQGYIWMLAWIAVGSVVLKGICMAASTHISHIAAYTILYDTRIELARKLGSLPLGYFSGRTTGEIKKIIHEDVEQLEEGLAHLIPDIAAGVTVPVIAGILLFLADWRMTLATLGSAVLALGLFGLIMSRFDMSAYNALLAKMNGAVIQYINGMKVVKAFARSDQSFGQLQTVIEEVRQVYVGISRFMAWPYATMLTLMRSAAITIIPTGIFLYANGSLQLTTFILFVLLGLGFNRPIMNVLFHGMTAFYQINAAASRVAQVFDEPSLSEPLAPKQPQGSQIEFEDVSFAYGQTEVLKQINFAVPQGSVTALVGPSGAGKSTIAKLIPRFWDVSQGSIRIGGVDVKEIPIEQLMNTIAFVFQDVFLFNDTVLENIKIGDPNATEDQVIAAAKVARCHEFIETLPQGYQTPVGENGSRLSGGQKQRISIARAVLKNAPIIILDEATAYVDPENEAFVQEALGGLLNQGQKTLVVIAHRLSTITAADQILVVDKGEIFAKGSHTDLLENCPLYAQQWQSHTSAQAWTWQRQATSAPTPVPSVMQQDPPPPLENPYADLRESDSVWGMIQKLTPPGSRRFLLGTIRWRLLEGIWIGISSYLVYLVLVGLFQDPVPVTQLWLYGGGIVACALGQIGTGYLANVQGWTLTMNTQSRLRLFLADYLRRLPLGFLTQRDTGTIDGLFTTTLNFLEPHHVLEYTISALVTPFLMFVVMLAYDWRLAWITAASVPFALIALLFAIGTFARVWRTQAEARVKANARMVEYIQGIPVLRAFNLAGDRLHQFRQGLEDYRVASVQTTIALSPAMTAFLSVLELGFAALLVVGTSFYLNGSLSGSQFLFFMVLGLAFFAPMMGMGEMLAFYRILQNGVRNIRQFLQAPILPEPQNPRLPSNTEIEFQRVSFSYGQDTVLDQVSFRIPEGSITALVGPSGSGKTTVTNLIARFWDVSEGSVRIGGVDVRDMATDTLMSQLTMVFQDVYLFNDTVRNNIQFGNPQASEAAVIAAAQAARCHEFIQRLPQGYDTVIGEGGSTLSGGEKQRISIARALLKDAPIVLLDEATASIDPENEQQIQQALAALAAQKTLVIIAHRLNTIQAADQILVLDQGRLMQQGSHAELIAQEGLYRQLVEARQQAKGWRLVKQIPSLNLAHL
jgi:ATP-binding cassette subfamily B protein